MTEELAKTKWCPMGFEAKYPHLFAGPNGKCKASACMMWRKLPSDAHYSAVAGTAVVGPDQGFCGLAGQP